VTCAPASSSLCRQGMPKHRLPRAQPANRASSFPRFFGSPLLRFPAVTGDAASALCTRRHPHACVRPRQTLRGIGRVSARGKDLRAGTASPAVEMDGKRAFFKLLQRAAGRETLVAQPFPMGNRQNPDQERGKKTLVIPS
jgi:hypothetical protein